MTDIGPGSVLWVDLDPAQGREQAGCRPALVVSNEAYLASIPDVIVVVPVTTRDRGLPHHVPLRGSKLSSASFAMTEQPRTVDRRRAVGEAGRADRDTMREVIGWLRDFLA